MMKKMASIRKSKTHNRQWKRRPFHNFCVLFLIS